MSHTALIEYIRKAKECGAQDAEVSERLLKAGWYRVDIDDALDLYRKLIEPREQNCQPIVAPRPTFTERIVPRWYLFRIVVIAALSFGFGLLLYAWLTAY